EQQKFGEADAQCREVIALEEKVLGADHPSTISSWYAFAYQLARQNKTEEAIQFARKAASAAEQVFGQDHPDSRKYALLEQKIESSTGTPQITIQSTTQIQPRSALQTNYIGRAYDKEQRGDVAGAIEDLEQAIEHQPARRDEACEHLARVKEKRGDWAGGLAA